MCIYMCVCLDICEYMNVFDYLMCYVTSLKGILNITFGR